MRRHEVTEHGWDEIQQKGWMRFRCLNCGYQYQMWMYTSLMQTIPAKRPGERARRRRMPYSKSMLDFLARWWRVGNGGCSVSACKGCLPKKAKFGKRLGE